MTKPTGLVVRASESFGTFRSEERKVISLNMELVRDRTIIKNEEEKEKKEEKELGKGISLSDESIKVRKIRRALEQLKLSHSSCFAEKEVQYSSLVTIKPFSNYKLENKGLKKSSTSSTEKMTESLRTIEISDKDSEKKLMKSKNRKRNSQEPIDNILKDFEDLAPPDKLEKNIFVFNTLKVEETEFYVHHKIKKSKLDRTTRRISDKIKTSDDETRNFIKVKRKIDRKLRKIETIREEFKKFRTKVEAEICDKSSQRLNLKRKSSTVILEDFTDGEVKSLINIGILENMTPGKKQKYSAPCNSPVNV